MADHKALAEAREALFAWHCAMRLLKDPADACFTPEQRREWERDRQYADRLYQLWLDAARRVLLHASPWDTTSLGLLDGTGCAWSERLLPGE